MELNFLVSPSDLIYESLNIFWVILVLCDEAATVLIKHMNINWLLNDQSSCLVTERSQAEKRIGAAAAVTYLTEEWHATKLSHAQ